MKFTKIVFYIPNFDDDCKIRQIWFHLLFAIFKT